MNIISSSEKSAKKLSYMLSAVIIILVILPSYIIVSFAQPGPPQSATTDISADSVSTTDSKQTFPLLGIGSNFTDEINYFQEPNITQIASQQNATVGIGADSFSIISRQEPNNNYQNTTDTLATFE